MNIFSITVQLKQELLHYTKQELLLRNHNLMGVPQRPIEKQLISELKKLCTNPLGYKPAEALRVSLIKDRKNLFTFLRYPGVQPTNNQAEQSIRFLVIFRKIMFGTRSISGLRTHSVLPSLVLTALRQGRNPREFLQILLTSDTAKAQAALYQNTS